MPLAPLATTTDLSDRGINTDDSILVDTMLDVASASIRDAAGSPISETTSTVVLDGWGDQLLRLPGVPVVSVSSVLIDGVATTDYKFTGSGLWRSSGWGSESSPVRVTVTQLHGLATVPADIVDLACNLAAAGQAEAAGMAAGGSFDPRVVVESVDDYRVQYAEGADLVASVFDLPAGTRQRLRARFGGGAGVVEYR